MENIDASRQRSDGCPTASGAMLPSAFVAGDGDVPGVGASRREPFRGSDGPGGAVLADVTVTIKNIDTGATRTIATDGAGHFQESGLPAGRFVVRAAKHGFVDEKRTGISLAVGQEITLEIKMQKSATDACANGNEFATTDCTLTWHGITVYGAYDVGVGWVSHGLPVSGYNYEGESLVNRNGYQHRFLIAPNNLQQTGLGVRARKSFCPAGPWCSTLPPASIRSPACSPTRQPPTQSTTAFREAAIRWPSTARAPGQPFNDEYYGGISSAVFGTLTFGVSALWAPMRCSSTIRPAAAMPFPTSGITARWPAAATPRTAVGTTPEVSPHLWPGPFRRDV